MKNKIKRLFAAFVMMTVVVSSLNLFCRRSGNTSESECVECLFSYEV